MKGLVVKTPTHLQEPSDRRVTAVGDSNIHRAEKVITKRVRRTRELRLARSLERWLT